MRLEISPPTHITGFYLIDSALTGNLETFRGALSQLALPAISMAIFSLAPLARMTRGSMLAVLVFAGAMIGFALSPHIGLAALFLFIAGIAEMINMSSNHTALQMNAPLAMRGRVASLLPMFPALMALGALSSGACADWLGAPGGMEERLVPPRGFAFEPVRFGGVRGVALLVNRYLKQIGITDRSGPHLLRHTFATHALRVRPNQRALHWAQARLYAWMLCEQHDWDGLEVALVYFHIDTGVETRSLGTISDLVERASNRPVAVNKSIVGAAVFTPGWGQPADLNGISPRKAQASPVKCAAR